MKILVDADACPVVIREILFKAAQRVGLEMLLIANQPIHTPPHLKLVSSVQVEHGFDVADNEIVRRAASGDMVITRDIPLAAEVLDKGAMALNFRGEKYNADTIKARLTMRDFMETLRSSGVHTGGQAPMSQADRREFANQLDRILAKHHKNK